MKRTTARSGEWWPFSELYAFCLRWFNDFAFFYWFKVFTFFTSSYHPWAPPPDWSCDGREIAEEKTQDLEIAQLIFEKEYDLKNHLFIKRNSKIDCFKLLEYELIAHRSEEKPINIEANSAILKIVTVISWLYALKSRFKPDSYTFSTGFSVLHI